MNKKVSEFYCSAALNSLNKTNFLTLVAER